MSTLLQKILITGVKYNSSLVLKYSTSAVCVNVL